MEKTFTLSKKSTGGRKLSTLFAAFIVLLITATSNTARASLSYDFVIDNLGYIINGDGQTVTLAGYDNSNELVGELIIPAAVTYEGNTYNVTAIREYALGYCSQLTSVTISKGVTSIGNSAFTNCLSLKAVTIPKSVTAIGNYAFYECTSLTSVTIPEGITTISMSLFYNCQSLTSITIPESVTSIGMYAFNGCANLTSVTIPKNVTSIGMNAFTNVKHIINKSQCTEYESWGAVAENGIVDGDFVYEDNTKTKLLAYIGKGGAVTIPDGVTSIGKYAFNNCTKCTSVTIPESVESIGPNAFDGIKYITNKSQCYDINHWGAMAENGIVDGDFVYENYTKDRIIAYIGKGGEVTIPEGVKYIGINAFSDCLSITSVTIASSVTNIPTEAFKKCIFLTSVTIKGEPFIGNDVFYQCINVDNVYLYANPDNLRWAEADCNDFKASKATKCHVYADYRDKYEDKFENLVNVTFVGDIKEVSSNDITISGISNVTYTGKAVEPIVVADGDKTLTPGTDYTITYTNNINVGTAKATIEGIKLYIFTKEVEFTIAPKQISSATITLSQAEYEYTGNAITPEATVKDGDATLKLNTDYTITYADNTAAGTAKITIAGKGNYTGTAEKTFTIKTTSTPVAQTDNSGSTIKVWSANHYIFISAPTGSQYRIYDLAGRMIKTATTKSSLEQVYISRSYIYIVIVNNKTFKVSL